MNIIFTMAGKYTRFRLFGAKVPKYLLPLGPGTILSKIIEVTKKSSKSTLQLLGKELPKNVITILLTKHRLFIENMVILPESDV